jgi:hypothetical protein
VNIITTICGDDIPGYSGDNGLAIKAKLNSPDGICLDKWNNLYIADGGNNRIRKINLATGIITTVAGNGTATSAGGFSGDGGIATNAKLWIPVDVSIDTVGNVYIADADNHRIRKIAVSTGIITTVAGSGPIGFGMGGNSGDGGPATNATLNDPAGIYVDKYGDIYIADIDNNNIRKVTVSTGNISTVAGTGVMGYSGNGGPATNAELYNPAQIYTDSICNIFFTELTSSVVCKVTILTGIITTIAGIGVQGYSGDNGPATNAKLNQPYGIYIDEQQNIFIAEYGNGTIRKINALTGIITTVAGTGTPGYSGDSGPATNAQLTPEDLCFDKYGTMYIADFGNDRIRRINDTALRVGILNLSKAELKIYPNPTTGDVTIENAKGSEVIMYDVVGKMVNKKVMTSNKEEMNIEDLPNGMYMIQVVDETTGIRTIRKIVKE